MKSRTEKWMTTGLVMMLTGLFGDITSADDKPVYSPQATRITQLDNGLIIEGEDVKTPDRFTSGFSVMAGFKPSRMPALDLGAEFSYHDSDAVPMTGDQKRLVDTTSLGGSLIAGIRLEDGFGLYAKSGLANWDSDGVSDPARENGTTRIEGFGARWQNNGVVSQLEYEHFDDASLSHLNRINASVRVPF
ncbi:hypothetical protein OM427_25375 [Halomonas sp. 18H]|uniref:hypothetical protein n=1 Tax=Halomonas almeriensis TaxID=308163 RepID=UPI0022312DCA|nr:MULTISPECIES: hypothetical protein [Halomonas]MCW4152851.1 hypothetical protein [Halomonas sp. 18H]MDN3551891.1 hypothetical protein [Halomonas almeriensis]